MAEQNQPITSLPIKIVSGIAETDYILGVDSAEGYQMLIQDLGDYIIQNVTSNLAGNTQTLKNIINKLNDETEIVDFGNISVARAAGDNTVAVTFSKTFSANPCVFVNCVTGEPTRFIPHVVSRSKTGATIGLYNTGASVTSSTTISWFAIGS